MTSTSTVTAVWDADAEVFTTLSDIPGLVVEAASLEEVVDLVRFLAPEVIAANIPETQSFYQVQIQSRLV